MHVYAGPQSAKTYPQEIIPDLTDDQFTALAERHLTELACAERTPLSKASPVGLPRVRKRLRQVWVAGVWLREQTVPRLGAFWNPRRRLGRLKAHIGLLKPLQTAGPWKLGVLALAAGLGVAVYMHVPWSGSLWFVSQKLLTSNAFNDIVKGLFATATLAFFASLWSDMVLSPFLGLRIRRHIRKDPPCIIHGNLGARPVQVVSREDPIEIAPRADLYDEVLPGILTKGKKDVQILVGEPGAGKTTALIWLADLLVRIGILPVLVPLRAKEGVKEKISLAQEAKDQFVRQVDRLVRSSDEAEKLWRWLYKRRRVAILTDDIDQIGADGERGALLRQTLEDAMTLDLPVVVTARPAGLPAGMAVSAIDVGPLREDVALEAVINGARNDPGFKEEDGFAPRQLGDWIKEGQLTEVPFYLELLASLAAAGRSPKLPQMDQPTADVDHAGRYRRMPDGHYQWTPLWVRFMLLEHYYQEVANGKVRRWLGIEAGERRRALVGLEGAALGTLVAVGLRARAAQKFRGEAKKIEGETPRREEIVDFLGFDDRDPTTNPEDVDEMLPYADSRPGISAHEAADTGERLRILDRSSDEKLQFRHRIMQAYLAGSRLAMIEFKRLEDEGSLEPEEGYSHEGGEAPRSAAGLKRRNRWVQDLLDRHHPEKLTANMALTFAAMCAKVEQEAAQAEHDREGRVSPNGAGGRQAPPEGPSGRPPGSRGEGQSIPADIRAGWWGKVAEHIVRQLHRSAQQSLGEPDQDHDGQTSLLAVEQRREAGSTMLEGALLVERADEAPTDDRDVSTLINPKYVPDPDEERADPDDALMKLTTAAEAAHAVGYRLGGEDTHAKLVKDVLEAVYDAHFATRWTKTNAIRAVARLGSSLPAARGHEAASGSDPVSLPAWERIWEFARDEDYRVRQVAADELCMDAYNAYRALGKRIDVLLYRAAARSALGMPLYVSEEPARDGKPDGWMVSLQVTSPKSVSTAALLGARSRGRLRPSQRGDDGLDHAGIVHWEKDESLSLEALGVVLPAIVSGLREDPEVHLLEAWQGHDQLLALSGERPSRQNRHRDEMSDVDYRRYGQLVKHAYLTLRRLSALAFQGNQPRLEDALARGFKGDAMRHAYQREPVDGSHSYAGPGWISGNRRIVLDTCVRQAGSWYARLLLAQALALYTIAGTKRQEAYNALAEQVHRGRELHPFAQRGARLARAAIRRSAFPAVRWQRWIWSEEIETAGRRESALNRKTSQLAADVTLLLDLKEGSPEDCQEPFGTMTELPYCLSGSPDRQEILGKGCPQSCGWNFCPHKQPPPDEPDAQRGVSRAFCRQQRHNAKRPNRVPNWQKGIKPKNLRAFWEAMEQRARR